MQASSRTLGLKPDALVYVLEAVTVDLYFFQAPVGCGSSASEAPPTPLNSRERPLPPVVLTSGSHTTQKSN